MANEGTVIINQSTQRLEIETFGTSGNHQTTNQKLSFDADFDMTTSLVSQLHDTFDTGDVSRSGLSIDIAGITIFISLQFTEPAAYLWTWDLNGDTGTAAADAANFDSIQINRSGTTVEVVSEGVQRTSGTLAGAVTTPAIRQSTISAADTANSTGVFSSFQLVNPTTFQSLADLRMIFDKNNNLEFVTDDDLSNITGANIDFLGEIGSYRAKSNSFNIEFPIGTSYSS